MSRTLTAHVHVNRQRTKCHHPLKVLFSPAVYRQITHLSKRVEHPCSTTPKSPGLLRARNSPAVWTYVCSQFFNDFEWGVLLSSFAATWSDSIFRKNSFIASLGQIGKLRICFTSLAWPPPAGTVARFVHRGFGASSAPFFWGHHKWDNPEGKEREGGSWGQEGRTPPEGRPNCANCGTGLSRIRPGGLVT